jgi:hypothetical protein
MKGLKFSNISHESADVPMQMDVSKENSEDTYFILVLTH